ncbi:MAG: DinB family protein [Blastocatellia bacterium]
MSISEALLPEFDREMANTRKTLERIPEDKFDWKPHEKSMRLGSLAIHLATMVGWVADLMKQDSLDLDPNYEEPKVNTRSEIIEMFDGGVASARAAIDGASDEEILKPWTLLSGGKEILTMPKAAVIRDFAMNHSIHHRAQLGVYLRLNDIPVPSIYGPSADEDQM